MTLYFVDAWQQLYWLVPVDMANEERERAWLPSLGRVKPSRLLRGFVPRYLGPYEVPTASR